MKSKLRRYEVLLPARFNDGTEVSDELLGDAMKEIMSQFGAVSFRRNAVDGYWQHLETTYHDELGVLVVDVADTIANRRWMKAFKQRWKKKLEQLEIWMVSFHIDVE